MNVDDFRQLYEYNYWANHRALEACAPLTEEQFTHDLGSSFGSVRDTLAHILLAEWLWLERWHGRSHSSFPPYSDFPNLESISRKWSEVERDILDYVASLTPEDLHRRVEYKTTAGAPQSSTNEQMLQHLANHGTYHRGQVTTLLRQLGAKAISTDLILFFRERAAKASA